LSAVDSQLKTRRFTIPELSGRTVFWWASIFAGLSIVVRDAPVSSLFVPAYWQPPIGAAMLLVSAIGLLHHYSVVNVRLLWTSRKGQIRERIDFYSRKGEELLRRLEADPRIQSGDTHRLVTDTWVNPIADYLLGTVGERSSNYFLSILRESAPDETSIRQFGYAKALARDRIKVRLERLSKIKAAL
jgi:hypothetical protein